MNFFVTGVVTSRNHYTGERLNVLVYAESGSGVCVLSPDFSPLPGTQGRCTIVVTTIRDENSEGPVTYFFVVDRGRY